jgi:GntR family transcriptional regulator
LPGWGGSTGENAVAVGESGGKPAARARLHPLGGGPLYRTVMQRLRDALGAGGQRPADSLTGEREIARAYGVSVGTARRALAELAHEGVLVRRPGRGTFMLPHTRDAMLERFYWIVDARGAKEFPRGRVLSFAVVKAAPMLAATLGCAAGAAVFEIDSVQSLGDEPVILDRLWVRKARFPGLTRARFAARAGTIFGLYQEQFGVTVVRVEESLAARSATLAEAKPLGLARGAAVLEIERRAYALSGEVVEFRRRVLNCARHRYLSVLGANHG